jgi:zinc/manganese transport system ATP-binding protein
MIAIKNLTVNYGVRPALANVFCTFPSSTMSAIVGMNGAGKSTMLKALSGLVNKASGQITFHGLPLAKHHIAYLPQSHQIDQNFPITVEEFVLMGAWQQTSFWRSVSGAVQQRCHHVLAEVHLDGFEKRLLSELSGGQFQRMLFARLLMQDAEVLLLDEPFSAVDVQTIKDLIQVLIRCKNQGKTIIAVIHDLSLVSRYFDHAVVLATRCVSSGVTKDALSRTSLSSAGYQFFFEDEIEESEDKSEVNDSLPASVTHITQLRSISGGR